MYRWWVQIKVMLLQLQCIMWRVVKMVCPCIIGQGLRCTTRKKKKKKRPHITFVLVQHTWALDWSCTQDLWILVTMPINPKNQNLSRNFFFFFKIRSKIKVHRKYLTPIWKKRGITYYARAHGSSNGQWLMVQNQQNLISLV